ncbi:MAG: ABC transporter permease [Deltaproteobacteria bacterium]|nr:ABC transporter permease [Deltaproteobacteria bacterium]
MRLPYELVVALRYVRAKRRAAVNLITLITIGGVAVGVCALTVVTSVWNGFEAEFLEKLLGINAHAVVLRKFDVFRDAERVSQAIEKDRDVELVGAFVYSEVIVQSARNVSGVAIKGVDPKKASMSPLGKYVEPSAFEAMARTATAAEPGILIGKELASSLVAGPGDILTAISPYGAHGGQPRTQSFRIVGVFHSGMFEFDSRMVFVDLDRAQRFFRLFNTVTGLEVWTKDAKTSKAIVKRALSTLSDAEEYEVRDWSDTNHGLFGAVRSQKSLITIVLGIIVVVASFNIVATLILLILEKSREIAVLKSLGASNRSILMVFVLDGQIVGLGGSLLGVLSGLAISAVLEEYGLKLDPRVYYLENLPMVVRPLEVGLVAVGAMLAATLATLFPAYKAATLPPVEGLRQGGLEAGLRHQVSATEVSPNTSAENL